MRNKTQPIILCVDDEPLILEVLYDIFESDYNIITTTDCKKALEECKRSEIEIIITDQNMPYMSGTEFLVKANKLNPFCKKILLTGFGETNEISNAIKLGVIDSFILKPFSGEDLINVVNSLLVEYGLYKQRIQTKYLSSRSPNKQSILIVDDDPFTIQLLGSIFSRKYTVYTATNVSNAHTIMKNNEIKLVMSNYTMPGENGLTFLEIIKEKYPYTGRILITDNDDMSPVLAEAINKKIIDKFVHKNNQNVLINFVHEVLMDKENDIIKEQFANAKISAVRQLASGVAHEINNPLGFLYSNLKNFKKFSKTLEEMVNNLDQIEAVYKTKCEIETIKEKANYHNLITQINSKVDCSLKNAERIRDIVKGFKDFSGVDATEHAIINVNETLDSVLAMVSYNKKSIIIKKTYTENIPKIKCPVSKLNMVFYNIMTNAYQSIKDTGTLALNTFLENTHVVVDIWNDGPIIPEDMIDRIFDPFSSTMPIDVSGKGLGLYTCYEIVQQFNGKLQVKSERGMGTTFTIKIPAYV